MPRVCLVSRLAEERGADFPYRGGPGIPFVLTSMFSILWTIIILGCVCAAQNLVKNGDFENSPSPVQADPWTLSPPGPTQVAVGSGQGRSGNAMLLQCQDTYTCQIWQSVSTDRATTYRLSFYAKQTQSGSPGSMAYFGASFGLNSQIGSDSNVPRPGSKGYIPSSISTDWTLYTIDAPGDGPTDLVLFYGYQASGAWAIDDVSVVALDSSGSPSISSGSQPSSTGDGVSQSTPPPTNDAGAGKSGSDLSSGSIVGISLGALTAACGLLAAIIKLVTVLIDWRKKKEGSKV